MCVLGTQMGECRTSRLCVRQFGGGVTRRDSVKKREKVDAQHRSVLGLCEWSRKNSQVWWFKPAVLAFQGFRQTEYL